MWANLHALTDAERQLIHDGIVAVWHEFYKNLNPALVLDDMHLPVISHLVAVYDGHGEQPSLPAGWRYRLSDYVAHGEFHRGDGVYGPGMTVDEYRALPA